VSKGDWEDVVVDTAKEIDSHQSFQLSAIERPYPMSIWVSELVSVRFNFLRVPSDL
jgi:hypothetical protein